MQRRIYQTNGNRSAAHRLEDAHEVRALQGQEGVQRLLPLLIGFREDHLLHERHAVTQEHVLGPAEADALGTALHRLRRLLWRIRIGTNTQFAEAVGPLHQFAHFASLLGRLGWQLAHVDGSIRAVNGDPVAFLQSDAVCADSARLVVNLQLAAAADGGDAKLPGNERRVRGPAAAGSQHTLAGQHAREVIWVGLLAHENQRRLRLFVMQTHCRLGVQNDLAGRGPGAGIHASGQYPVGGLLREPRMHGLLQLLRCYAVSDRLLACDYAFVHQVHGDLHRCHSGALSCAALEDEEPAVFDGEFDVLHLAVVTLQDAADLLELRVDGRVLLRECLDIHGSAHTRHHILALRVHQILAVELLGARRRVARKGNAGTGVVAHVSEHHRLHVDRRADGIVNLLLAAVDDGSLVVPGAEDGLDGALQLLHHVLREGPAGLGECMRLELLAQLLQAVGIHIGILLGA